AKEFAKVLYSEEGYSTGMAFKIANEESHYDLYALFGDPSYHPLNDNKRIELTLLDKEENPIDTMMAVQDIYIRASIPVEQNIDTISFEFQNPEQQNVKRKDGFDERNIAYTLPGIITKRYIFPVENGVVNAQIRSPLIEDISTISIRAYGWSKDCPKTVTGMAKDIAFHDVDYDNIDKTDKTGPSIVASLAQNTTQTDTLPGAVGNRIVIDGFEKKDDGSSHPANLDIYFTDKSGIDFWSKNPGEGITVSIKDVRKSE
ncbi:MAG: hypothetical protein GY786_14665, partial [Proteobacteria bacterium]|nr:hypothetical protein [Pseudomonadota bacterium]